MFQNLFAIFGKKGKKWWETDKLKKKVLPEKGKTFV